MDIQITTKKSEGVERLLEVSVPIETVREAEETTARRYASSVRLPGFRPGKAPRRIRGPALSKDVADQVKAMMLLSEQHTGGAGKQANVKIASKPGTAEHGTDPKNTPPHAWYVAFAPADNPQIAVCVVVENGGDRGLAATGSSVAAGVGRATINAYLAGGG